MAKVLMGDGTAIDRAIYRGRNMTTNQIMAVVRYNNAYYWAAPVGNDYQMLGSLTHMEVRRAGLRPIY